MIFQILFLLFSVYAIAAVIRRRRDGMLSSLGSIYWTGFWLLADVVVIIPDSTTRLANTLGIGRGSDLIVYLALALVCFLLFRMHVRLYRMERDITTLVRAAALSDTLEQEEEIDVLL